jgi:hypothetical protein
MNHRLAAVLALAGSASLALAQVVTPTPSKAPEPDKPAAQPQPIPMQPPPGIVIDTGKKPKQPPVILPDLKYKSLVEKDKDGKVVRISEPAEYAALKNNPMIKPEELPAIQEHLKARKASFEVLVADNLDLVEQIEGGLFETVPLATQDDKKKNLQSLLNAAKPLKAPSAPKPLHEDLRERQVLTPEQAGFNQKISKEYHDALIAEAKVDATRGLALIYKSSLDEPLYYHRLMLLEGAGRIDEVAGAVDAETAGKVKAHAAAIKGAKTDQQKLDAMGALNKDLSLEQRKAVLRAVISSRAAKK